MKLSVIICIYNTKRDYFKKCLDSIVNSTLDDYEICVVDDGSSLDYSDFVSEYKLKYLKTENKGILSARLKGIEMAEGEYSTFVDSDDTVSFNYHRPMTEEADRQSADIVINDWAFHTERARYFCKNDSTIAKDISAHGEDVLFRFLSQCGREHSLFVLWNKIYKTSLLKSSAEAVRLTDISKKRSTYAEDALFNFFAFRGAKKLVNIHTGYYFYRIHTGQSVNVCDKEKLMLQISLMSKTLNIMRENLPDTNRHKEMLSFIDEWGRLMSRTHYSYAKSAGYTELYEKIKEAYCVENLKKSTMSDQSAYVNNSLLPDNFEEIDKALLSVWNSGVCHICYDISDGYIKRCLEYISAQKDRNITYSKSSDFKIPSPSKSFKNKLLHNYFVYNLGLLLFKKGSKIRAILKKKL